jgi:CHAT domain-containing protein/Tfp pilus assembly protein PilF
MVSSMSVSGALLALTLLGDSAPRGVEVVRVFDESAGRRAGLQPGDVVVAWSQDGLDRPLRSPFEVDEIESVEGPLHPVTFRIGRAGAELSLTVGAGEWGLVLRPSMDDGVRSLYEAGGRAASVGERAGHWRAAAVRARDRAAVEAAIWLFAETGRVWAEAGRLEESDAAFRDANALATDDVTRAQIATAQGRACERSAETYDRAEEALREALRLREAVSATGLATAAAWHELGECLLWRGDRTRSGGIESVYGRALELRAALAPNRLPHAVSLMSMAYIDYAYSRMDSSDVLSRQALAIAQAIEPHGVIAAHAFWGMGRVAWASGRVPESIGHFHHALEIRAPIDPGGFEVARSKYTLGLLEENRGDLAKADDLIEEALESYRHTPPNIADVLAALEVRAGIARERGDLEAARSLFTQTTQARERLSLISIGTARGYMNLGDVAVQAGNLAEARAQYQKALPIFERYFPGTQWHSETLYVAGEAARRSGDLGAATEFFEKALVLEQERAPGGLNQANVLQARGALAEGQGDLDGARSWYEQALKSRERLAPGSAAEAESLLTLGLLARRQGRETEATALMQRAVEAVEKQLKQLGGTQEGQSAFHARHGDVHRAWLALLVEEGRPEEALHVLEQSRARVLLQQMAERDLSLPDDVPPELEQERRRVRAEYQEAEQKLAALGAEKDRAEADVQIERLRDLQRRRESLMRKLRAASPRAASLRDPEPLDAAGVAAALDPGTVLLSYAVDREKTRLFVVNGPTAVPEVYTLPIGDDALRARVAAFRERIRTSYDTGGPALRSEARALFDLLLGPAVAAIATADRVLLCPDGPLHVLPFAALLHGRQYLVEWKPLHVVASATLYAELRRERETRRPPGAVDLVAFGDPQPNPKRIRGLDPLPAARREVGALQTLFGARARTYVGRPASEAGVRRSAGQARYVHFACHAIVDDRLPLDSALALSPAGDDDGLLQAWEIFESVRLNADLVVLSGCKTGLGREAGGEGLLSLTRAFLFAGAHSTLASLWSVPDSTTGRLMESFYARLRRGETKDQALRAAQLQMLRDGMHGAPLYWAGFELFGDWR